MVDKNKVKIELYKSKEMAKFSHQVSGTMYYTVELADGKYQFPILTTEERKFKLVEVIDDEDVVIYEFTSLKPSSDLGTTAFEAEMRGSELNRWIGKAIDKKEFIKVG